MTQLSTVVGRHNGVMHGTRAAPVLVGAALCAVLAGCGPGPDWAAQRACSHLREVTAEHQAEDSSISTYFSRLQAVAQDAQDAEEPDMISAGVSLESATSYRSDVVHLGQVATATRTTDRMDDTCDGLGF